MHIYIAGPMRGIAEFNFPAFDQAAENLTALGHLVCNPAAIDRNNGFKEKGLTGTEDLATLGFDLRKALAYDLDWICRKADAVFALPGWQGSRGARAEVATAVALGLPVYTRYDDLDPAPTIDEAMQRAGYAVAKAQELGTPSHYFRAHPNGKTEDTRTFADRMAEQSLHAVRTQPGEVRTTSATGGQKGTKEARFDLLPVEALTDVARLYGRGATKYADHNWRRGYEWSKSYASLMRHATQFWGGEDTDEELGLPHMAAVAFHALALLTFMRDFPQYDDRFKP